jgi:hypothetical protein
VEPTPGKYARRRPDKTVLYQVVREHAETLFAQARDRSAGGYGYPAHVEKEFRRYIECGIFGRGFLRLHCAGCGRDELVAFSCYLQPETMRSSVVEAGYSCGDAMIPLLIVFGLQAKR